MWNNYQVLRHRVSGWYILNFFCINSNRSFKARRDNVAPCSFWHDVFITEVYPFNVQCSYHVEAIQLICRTNQLTDFFITGSLIVKGSTFFTIRKVNQWNKIFVLFLQGDEAENMFFIEKGLVDVKMRPVSSSGIFRSEGYIRSKGI